MKLRVMAVDDEPVVLRMLRAMLESLGCEVIALQDGREALERLKREKVDGLFVDVAMPNVDGFTLTREVRVSKLNSRIPIVVLSGQDDAETMRRGFEAGATFFLGKPFTRERIYKLLGATRGSMLTERRRYSRISYHTEVDCTWGGEPPKHFRSNSVNISEGGMKLAPSGGVPLGQELDVAFNLPNIPRVIRARAEVMREVPPDTMGIHFLKLNDLDREDLRTYIAARLEQ